MNRVSGRQRLHLPALQIQHLWPIAVLAGIFVFLSLSPIRPHDFWWHLRLGQEIVSTGRIPAVDQFSYTMAGAPYPSYSTFWLVDSLLYELYAHGGPALVIFVHSLAITGAYALLLWTAYRESRSWRAAAVATLFAAALGFDAWNVRPQAIAYPLGALFLWAIYAYRRRPRPWLLALFPLGMLAWVNSHGSWVIGLAMLAVWLAAEAWQALRAHVSRSADRFRGGHCEERLPRRSNPGVANHLPAAAVALGLSCLACLANPRGVGVLAYVRDLSGSPVIRSLVPEWAPPSLDTRMGVLFFAGLLLSALVLALSPRRPGAFQLLTFAVFGLLGLRTSRGIVWFGMVMAPVLAPQLVLLPARLRAARRATEPAAPLPPSGAAEAGAPPARLRGHGGRPVANTLLVCLICAGVLLSLPWFKHVLPLPPLKAGLVSAETPVAATDALLRLHPPGRVFHALPFGSYLIWAAQPDYPVFVDTRLELYPLAVWRDYLSISAAADGWERRLAEYGVNTLMLSPQEQPALVSAVDRSPDWRPVYRDPQAVLYVRVTPTG
jgi:hypothetical protein